MINKPTYIVYCDFCGNKFHTDGTSLDNIILYKRSPIMINPPTLDIKTNKTVVAKFANLPKKYKCQKCGRLMSVKKEMEPPK